MEPVKYESLGKVPLCAKCGAEMKTVVQKLSKSRKYVVLLLSWCTGCGRVEQERRKIWV